MSINSKQLFLCLIALLAIIIATEGCKVTIKIKSQTKNKFRIQVFIPSIKQKTERVSFEGPEEKKVAISGENCLGQKWVVRTWKPDGNGDWVGAKQESAKIDGMGWMRIIVDDNLIPRIHDRMAIFCSEGDLCG